MENFMLFPQNFLMIFEETIEKGKFCALDEFHLGIWAVQKLIQWKND